MNPRMVPLLALFAAACSNVLSLSPAVSAAAAVMDDRLLGEWIVDDTSPTRMRVTVTRGQDRSYRLHFVEDGDSTTAIGRLMPIGQRWLLDLSPTREAVQAIDRYNGIPVHMQVVLEMSDSMIRASAFNADTLKTLARNGTGPALGVAYPPGGDVLLTDTTVRLGAGLAQYLSRPGVTREWKTYRRLVTHRFAPGKEPGDAKRIPEKI